MGTIREPYPYRSGTRTCLLRLHVACLVLHMGVHRPFWVQALGPHQKTGSFLYQECQSSAAPWKSNLFLHQNIDFGDSSTRLKISGIASQFAIQNACFTIHNKLMHSKIANHLLKKQFPPTFELWRRSPAKLVPGPLEWSFWRCCQNHLLPEPGTSGNC